jgi:hypothetical protein
VLQVSVLQDDSQGVWPATPSLDTAVINNVLSMDSAFPCAPNPGTMCHDFNYPSSFVQCACVWYSWPLWRRGKGRGAAGLVGQGMGVVVAARFSRVAVLPLAQ